MKITIDPPDVPVQQARQKALHLGRPFKDLVAGYIRQGRSELSATALTFTSGALAIADNGLPVSRPDPSVKGPAGPIHPAQVAVVEGAPILMACWMTLACLNQTAPQHWMDACLAAKAITGVWRLVTVDRDIQSLVNHRLDLQLSGPRVVNEDSPRS